MSRVIAPLLVVALLLAGCCPACATLERIIAPPAAAPPPGPTAAALYDFEGGYATLELLDAGIILLAETALDEGDGRLDREEARAQLANAQTLLLSIDGALAGPPPREELATAWEGAREVSASALGVVGRWLEGEITAGEAGHEFEWPMTEIGDICRAASALAEEGGIPAYELDRVRALALSTFRDVMEGRATPPAL